MIIFSTLIFLMLIFVIGVPILFVCSIFLAIYRGSIVSVKQIGTQGNKVFLKIHYERGKDYITAVKFGSSDHKEYMKYMQQ